MPSSAPTLKRNAIRTLPRSTRRLCRPTTDPRETPFLERLSDVQRVFAALPEPIAVAFGIGALAGLRRGEVVGLEWRDIDLAARRMNVRRQVQNGRRARLKDDDNRVVPLQKPRLPILASWKLRTGGEGLLFRPTWCGGLRRAIRRSCGNTPFVTTWRSRWLPVRYRT